jgi:ribosomal protein S18 acetylase RimI-like enzyme
MSEIVDSGMVPRITVRDVEKVDVPVLTAIKGVGTETLHRDRLRDAQSTGFRYLVLLADKEIVGFACLVIRRPQYWSDADDTQHLPQIVDLQIKESHRGRGYGSDFLRAIERIASEAGYAHLYLSVGPLNNPRAYALYQRLGYEKIQSEPYRKIWEFHDSDGKKHHGEDWVVDMVKQLNREVI